MAKNKKHTVSSMTNALHLLNLFSVDNAEWSLTDLAVELDVGPSTIYRITNTLIHEGFLVRDPLTKNFRLGSQILPLGHLIISSYEICDLSPPILEKLVQNTGETVHLSIVDANQTIYIQKFECPNYVSVSTHVGKHNPVHCTSTGQIILAYQSNERINEVISSGLTPFTPYTITDSNKFRERLTKIRKQGFTFNIDEMDLGVSAIAAPVKSPSGKVEFSVSIAGPNSRINHNSAPLISKYVLQAADELSKKLKS